MPASEDRQHSLPEKSGSDLNEPAKPRTFRVPDHLLLPFSPRATISVARAAEMLDVSDKTIERMCQDGTFSAYKKRDAPNSPWHISYDSVIAYIERIHEVNGLERRFRNGQADE